MLATYGVRSLVLAVTALLIAYGIAIPLGVLAAVRRHSIWDQASMFLANLGMGIPSFWLALLLILLFGATLHWLPIEGSGDVRHLVLPALVLSVESLAVTTRLMRSSMLEQLGQDYVRTLRAKGVRRRRIIWVHVVRNALIPIISLTGLRIGWLIGYAVIVETVFRWPGLGYQLVDSVIRRDYPVAQGLSLLLTFIVLSANFFANVAYAVVDPRIRKS
jgi:ABC-type dipeptide/oligopeptide/nickel transport system permease component